MTPTRDLDTAAFRAEVALRVNARLAEQERSPARCREVVSALKVAAALRGTGQSRTAYLIREIAAQVAAQMGAK
ncbi:MAG: hypothetical protein V1790_17455 [Planctomycetota bacterium]